MPQPGYLRPRNFVVGVFVFVGQVIDVLADVVERNILSSLLKLFELLDTTGLNCRKALTWPLSDFEDTIMSESALRAGVGCIVTRNERDYRQSPVPVLSPAALLEQLLLTA